VNMCENDIDLVSSQKWSCSSCTAEFRLRRSASESTPVRAADDAASCLTLDNLGEVLDSFKREVLTGQGELAASLRSCHEKLDNNSALLSSQEEIIRSQNEIIARLQSENENLRKKLEEVCVSVDNIEQRARLNTVEIHGIPSRSDENVETVVLDVCRAVGMDLRRDAIDCCHRLKRVGDRPTAGVVVKFVRRSDAEELLRKRRVKKDLSSANVGFPGSSFPVYINRSLTALRRKLFSLVKQKQREKGWKYVWLDASGHIKVRMLDGSAVFRVNSTSDLEKL
jgi:hypothetical protein